MDLRQAVTLQYITLYRDVFSSEHARSTVQGRKNVSLATSAEVGPHATPGYSDVRV